MELLRLRRRLELAHRGHKLLKDKQDELVRRLILLARVLRRLREEFEAELRQATQSYIMARSAMSRHEVDLAFLMPRKRLLLEVGIQRILNLRAPKFERREEGDIHCYGFAHTPAQLDAAMIALDKAFNRLIELAEKEKTLQLLAMEIERTRRRVNALEHVVIPNLQDTLAYITSRMAELERSNISRLMRIKEIVRAH
jgi:V/A-type H+-transporting ATPase subunit D